MVGPEDVVMGLPLAPIVRIRAGNMLDLLGRREEALKLYKDVEEDKSAPPPVKGLVARYVATPFARPAPGKGEKR
jgi:hypothetical protein